MMIKALHAAKKKDGLDPSAMAQLDPLGMSQLVYVLLEWVPNAKACDLLINTEKKLQAAVKDRSKQIGPGLHGLDRRLSNLVCGPLQEKINLAMMDPSKYTTAKAKGGVLKKSIVPKAGQLIADTSAVDVTKANTTAVDHAAYYGKFDVDKMTKCGRFFNSHGVWQWIGFPNEDFPLRN